MIDKAFGQGDLALSQYAEEVFHSSDAALEEIRERAEACGLPAIHVGRMDALHLEVLTRACGARRAVEIGTLAGLSGLAILRGLAADGVLHTFEYDPAHARVAEETFRKNGYGDRAKIYVGAALDRLPEIEAFGPFDLVFIDADKENYPNYLSWAETHLRIGGLILADNTFGFGKVPQASSPLAEAGVRAIDRLNRRIASGGRFRGTMLPTSEGLTLGVKVR